MEAKGWEDERLKVLVLQAVALQAHGDKDQAVHNKKIFGKLQVQRRTEAVARARELGLL